MLREGGVNVWPSCFRSQAKTFIYPPPPPPKKKKEEKKEKKHLKIKIKIKIATERNTRGFATKTFN